MKRESERRPTSLAGEERLAVTRRSVSLSTVAIASMVLTAFAMPGSENLLGVSE